MNKLVLWVANFALGLPLVLFWCFEAQAAVSGGSKSDAKCDPCAIARRLASLAAPVGKVDAADFNVVISCMGGSSSKRLPLCGGNLVSNCCPASADLDCSGKIDRTDYSLALTGFQSAPHCITAAPGGGNNNGGGGGGGGSWVFRPDNIDIGIDTPPASGQGAGYCEKARACITCSNLGDFNGDGAVTGLDLTYLLACYGGSDAQCLRLDLNRDGSVSFLDIEVLFALWGPSCSR